MPGDDHYAWLEARLAEGLPLPGPGPVELAGSEGQGKHGARRVIAQHRGLWQYTEGQRRGLRIPWSEPIYVLKRDVERNTLIVGPKHHLPVETCSARNVNLMVPSALWPEQLFVRVRYHQSPVPATVILDVQNDRMEIRFRTPQQPPAPGQIAAVYDSEGFVLAGAVLD